MQQFTYTRLYADRSGETHFEDVAVPLNDQGIIGSISDSVQVTELFFRESPPDYDWDFHCAPRRQFIVLLDGVIEIETSLGDKRVFRAGDVLAAEDTHGKGHKTKHLVQQPRRSIFISYR